jgi:hypothetical protein
VKKAFIFVTVLSITIMLLAGCTASESTQTPDQTAPVITVPEPGQESPDSAPAPDQTTPSPDPTPAPPVKLPSAESATGTIKVFVTDALPEGYEIDAVYVNFLEVAVHMAADGPDGEAGWKTLGSNPGGFFNTSPINLYGLGEAGDVALLAANEIDAGKYTQLRLIIDEAEGEGKGVWVHYSIDGVPQDPVQAKLPSGILKFIRPFTAIADQDTIVTFDFILDDSIVFTGASQSEQPKVIFKPVVKLAITTGMGDDEGECDTDAELILENKDPDSDWAIIDDDGDEVYGNEDEQDIYGVLHYSTEGEVFCYDFQGFNLDLLDPDGDGNWSLIYYADYEDRFNEWGGDNPGALIASGTAVDGTLVLEGSINLREDLTEDLGMDLPHPDDANSYYWNYADDTDPNYTGDGYDTAYGAKIWLVPSDYYDPETFEVTDWMPASFLFETDLITFDDTDNESEPLE